MNIFRLFKDKNMGYDSWTSCMKKYLGKPNIYQVDFNAKTKNMELLKKQYSFHQNPFEIGNRELQCTDSIRNLNPSLYQLKLK